jgi:transcriptional regulator with XRE-family HTH domain
MDLFLQTVGYAVDTMAGRPPLKEAPRFGQRLAVLRKQQGLSQKALAGLLGTTRNNIAYYERKADNPSLDFIERCARALRVSSQELIGHDQKGKPGRPSKLHQKIDQIGKLPRSTQQYVLQFLDQVLTTASREEPEKNGTTG